MKRLRILTVVSLLLAVLVYQLKHPEPATTAAGKGLLLPKKWLKEGSSKQTPAKDIRPADQTFLTYPEWFLVFSPAEQAEYFKGHTSTTFPYFIHTLQLWQGYHTVYEQIRNNFQFNTGYHVMIWVIGVSTTVEYGIKTIYESIIGGLTNTAPGVKLTEEDRFNASYMADYVSFIEKLPWYEFDFMTQLKKLWSETPIQSEHVLRKLERRYYLTTELLVKAGYGWLIKQGTKSAYEEALLTTAVIQDEPFQKTYAPKGVEFGSVSAEGVLYTYPRYADFKNASTMAAEKGVKFKYIAGNAGTIMLSYLSDNPVKLPDTVCRFLFSQPLPTRPGKKRFVLATRVSQLHIVLLELKKGGLDLEHVYDY